MRFYPVKLINPLNMEGKSMFSPTIEQNTLFHTTNPNEYAKSSVSYQFLMYLVVLNIHTLHHFQANRKLLPTKANHNVQSIVETVICKHVIVCDLNLKKDIQIISPTRLLFDKKSFHRNLIYSNN